MNVDEFLQEAETLSVQDMPRSASSLSVRTDASGAAVIIKMRNMQFAEFYLEIYSVCQIRSICHIRLC